MKNKIIIILLIFLSPFFLAAQETTSVFQGFSGGMTLHSGYLFGVNPKAPAVVEGFSNGMGGAMRVNLWSHLRVGAEGYVSTLDVQNSNARDFLADGSSIRTGLGGVLVDFCWHKGRWWPYLGVGVGGGAMRGLYILEGSQNDWSPEPYALFNKQTFFYVSPFVGTDFCLTPKVHLTVKADWMLSLHDGSLLQPTGMRLFLGFMFCH
jgi:hypothetical protein